MSAFVNNLKEKFSNFNAKVKSFIEEKDDSGKRKNRTSMLLIGVFSFFVLTVIILLCVKGSANSLEKHPQDITSVTEEVSFDDNQAVAVDENTIDSFELEIRDNSKDTVAPVDDYDLPEVTTAQPEHEAQTPSTNEPSANAVFNLYCDSFTSTKAASEHKANIALSTGYISEVVSRNGAYRMHLGPYNTREEAVAVFNKLDSLSLVGECTLTSGE